MSKPTKRKATSKGMPTSPLAKPSKRAKSAKKSATASAATRKKTAKASKHSTPPSQDTKTAERPKSSAPLTIANNVPLLTSASPTGMSTKSATMFVVREVHKEHWSKWGEGGVNATRQLVGVYSSAIEANRAAVHRFYQSADEYDFPSVDEANDVEDEDSEQEGDDNESEHDGDEDDGEGNEDGDENENDDGDDDEHGGDDGDDDSCDVIFYQTGTIAHRGAQ